MEGLATTLVLLGIFVMLRRGVAAQKQNRPHIIYILADDLGWNDVGFTGNSELQTPNLDALAYNGRILTRHYSQYLCTPSRTALFTSRYPIRSGMQGSPLSPAEPRALPLNEKLLPQYFKDLGYQTHLVGKWHLGYYDWRYLPTARGAFDTHFGYLNGLIGYFDHEIAGRNVTAHDFWRNLEPQQQLGGRYVTDLLTEESVRLIEAAAPDKKNESEPLFLFISHLAVHAGNPGDNDLEYPAGDLDRFSYIPDLRRRKLAAMVWNLDKSVGQVVTTLADNNMLSNSIIVFASDNGAQTVGHQYQNDGSNYPLRGLKNSVFEGGVHTTALIWSQDLQAKGISSQLFHLTDWLPTLFHAAGGDMRELSGLDGQDQWPYLLKEVTGDLNKDEYAGREELLVNMDEKSGQQSVILRNWKLVIGTKTNGAYDAWFGNYTNANYKYQTKDVLQSPASMALSSLLIGRMSDEINMVKIRNQAKVHCDYTTKEVTCNPVEAACLFDLSTDPCERVNLYASRSDIVMQLTAKLQTYFSQLKPQLNMPADDAAYTHIVNNTWFPWQGNKNAGFHSGKTTCDF